MDKSQINNESSNSTVTTVKNLLPRPRPAPTPTPTPMSSPTCYGMFNKI